MAILNTGDFPIDPSTTTGTDLADRLNRQLAAIVSSHANTARPSYLTAGGIWAQPQTAGGYKLFFYDGTSNHEMGSIDASGLAYFGTSTPMALEFSAAKTYRAGDIIYDKATKSYLEAKTANGPAAYNAGDWQALTDVLSIAVKVTSGATGAANMPRGTTAQRPTGAQGLYRYNTTTALWEGHNGSQWVSIFDALAQPVFIKADSSSVAFTKTGNGTATIKAGTKISVGGALVNFASATSITMPTLTAGTDYAIWVKDDATIQATTDHTSPPSAGNWRKIGGFHYAPGGNATATSGGNTTAQINEFSFWDLKFRPSCPDPRGMALVANAFWMDIYLTGVDAITNGSSKYNVTMADGSSPPKIPTMFGGNGSSNYGSYTWFQAMELASAFGKRAPTQREFMAAAYGTTEASSIGTDQNNTVLNAAYTSKWGIIQATGVLWVWGDDRGGPEAAASWNANTGGRGSEYNAPNAALFGGTWANGSVSGSRCSVWNGAASNSYDSVGSRFACDHLQLD